MNFHDVKNEKKVTDLFLFTLDYILFIELNESVEYPPKIYELISDKIRL